MVIYVCMYGCMYMYMYKVGITHEFSIDQLNIQSDLIKKAKSKSTDDVKYKVIFINNSFKTISIVSESQQYDE